MFCMADDMADTIHLVCGDKLFCNSDWLPMSVGEECISNWTRKDGLPGDMHDDMHDDVCVFAFGSVVCPV